MYKQQEWKDEIPDLSKPILDSTGKQKVDPQTGRPLWELVQEGTRITSARLNHMEQGIMDAHDTLNNITPEAITVDDPELEGKNLLAVLKYLKSLANSIKTKVAAAIGSPATGGDTGDQLAQKINDAKAVGASNLSAKGVSATATESLASLFSKIGSIVKGSGNAQPPEVLTGKTFTNDGGVPLTGTMPFRSAENQHMPSSEQTVWAGDRIFLKPPYGYYDGFSWVTAQAPHLRPENIVSGANILGVQGTAERAVPGRIGVDYVEKERSGSKGEQAVIPLAVIPGGVGTITIHVQDVDRIYYDSWSNYDWVHPVLVDSNNNTWVVGYSSGKASWGHGSSLFTLALDLKNGIGSCTGSHYSEAGVVYKALNMPAGFNTRDSMRLCYYIDYSYGNRVDLYFKATITHF